jgi:hypothetical protein
VAGDRRDCLHCAVHRRHADGRTVCRNGAAATQAGAERIAGDTACTDLSSGMTSLMQCQNNAPRKVTWK